jgi:hypothetical protein
MVGDKWMGLKEGKGWLAILRERRFPGAKGDEGPGALRHWRACSGNY